MEEIKFNNLPLIYKKSKRYFRLTFLIVIFLYLISLGVIAVDLFKGNFQLEHVAITCFLPTIILFFTIYGEPNFVIDNSGIEIQFILSKFNIQWDEVLKISENSSYSRITVKKLTFFNIILGLWTLTLHPVFMITRNYDHYNEAVSFIRHKIERKKKLS